MKRISFYLLLLFLPFYGSSELYINEFMASNAGGIKDPDFNNDADWLEIYNDGTSAVDLNGYYLTDNLSKPDKWMINNVTIPSKGFVLFWADGMDTLTYHTNFKLAAEGEQIGLFKHDLSVVDSITYGLQQTNVSHGRNINNLDLWGDFNVPTPGTANTTSFYTNVVLNEPMFNLRGGIYHASQLVTLSTDMGGTIRYTVDGSEPTINSTLYSNPISFDTTTVIRARIFKPNMLPGPIITNSYFIDSGIRGDGLAVVSVSSDPANFWDSDKGIYVQSFKPDWEIPVNIEMFSNDGSDRAAFNQQAGMKINGLYSWQLPQKMLGVYFKKRYGKGTLDYTIFPNDNRTGFKTFALRASGNDWSNTMMRDILGANCTRLNMNLDISDYRWCTVYFNGEYMGIHNFREKIETDYIEKHYGMDAGTFDMVENQDYAECGDLNAYNDFITLFSKDLSNQANFDAVANVMNVEDFTDLVITEIESGNSSIDHNVMAWKPKGSGKWKWILMDLDRGFFTSTSDLISFSVGQRSFPFSDLMKNAAYKAYFGKRLADHLYTSFYPAYMDQLIDHHHDQIEAEIPRHVARWLGTTSSYGNAMPSVAYWENEVTHLKTFVEERVPVLLNDLSNYGYNSGTALLTLSNYPAGAGTLKFNGFKVGVNDCSSLYLKNVASTVEATEKAGYTFKGWVNATKNVLIAKQSVWKYLDDGSDRGTSWRESSFDDSSWKSGQAELGYGDGGEATTVSYGPSSSNKYITTYFRKSFNITDADLQGNEYWIHLRRDDGAIVYINGTEVLRDNISTGDVNYKTLATYATGGINESNFFSFPVDKSVLKSGSNVIAVEIHQAAVNSSDISFDLELSYYKPDESYISTNKTYPFTLSEDLSLIAVYEPTGECVVPSEITENTTLHKSCSPYVVSDDVTVDKNVTLTIEPGVEILMSPGSNFYIHGNVNAIGTSSDSITFKINPKYGDEGWGALNFWNCTATSNLKYVTIMDATVGPVPQRVGAINTFYGNMNMDHIRIDHTKLNPISARYSDILLTNSYIHSTTTSDLINVKYGHSTIKHCTFVGNPEYDSDGIDYDGIENGVISNTKIFDIMGNNADAIDIGEEAHNIQIDSVLIINAFDKGVSVGQRSSVILTNSLLVNCNLGLGIKDSSDISVNQCTFYGNGISVDCYEKNPGRAGGNAIVKNSILSNAVDASYNVDDKSTARFTNCLSDNDTLPENGTNIFGDPLFVEPTNYDFTLQNSSIAKNAGNNNGVSSDLGMQFGQISKQQDVMICQLYLNPLNTNNAEYLTLYNPSNKAVDVSGYSFAKGIDCIIPNGVSIPAHDSLFITSDLNGWSGHQNVIQWTSGKLSNEGEGLELLNQYGLKIDYLHFRPNSDWPANAFASDASMSLKSSSLDNHFGYNWKADRVLSGINLPYQEMQLKVYPNPAYANVSVEGNFNNGDKIRIYNITGQLIRIINAQDGKATFNVSGWQEGIYLISIGDKVAKLNVMK